MFTPVGVTMLGKRGTPVDGVIGDASPNPVTFGIRTIMAAGIAAGSGMFDWLRE